MHPTFKWKWHIVLKLKEKTSAEIMLLEAGRTGCGPELSVSGHAVKPLRQEVFEAVRAAGQISRIDIAKKLSVSPGSVTSITSDLLTAGLVVEVEGTRHDGALRGRPPVALSIAPGAGYVVGLKLGDFEHSAVVVDFAGAIVAKLDLRKPLSSKEVSALIAQAEGLLADLLTQAGIERSQIRAVGLGLAGIVDFEAGMVPWSPLFRERDVQLRELISVRIGLPVYVDNDANMVTLAELWFGAGRSKSSFAVVTIEHGVGMGLVIDNRLYRGAMGLGMELGHTKVHLDGALCRCGNRGCLEAYVADYALVREARVALDMDSEAPGQMLTMLERLFDQAKAGNEQARSIFHRAARYLSLALSNIVHLFDPDLIILSGERMRYDYLYAEEVLAEMEQMTLDNGRPPPKVETHVWDGFVWARGAAALALSAVTDETFGEAWSEALAEA